MNDPHLNSETNLNAQRQRGRSNLTWILLVGTLFLVIAAPTMILLFFGLLPTLVAYIIDRTAGKSATCSVGGLNLIGVSPYVISLWTGSNTIDAALTSVSDLFIMLVMYSSAAFGWLLFLAMPTVISSFVLVLQQRKVAQLRGEQKNLIDEWGAEVAALVEMDRMESLNLHTDSGPSEPAMPGETGRN